MNTQQKNTYIDGLLKVFKTAEQDSFTLQEIQKIAKSYELKKYRERVSDSQKFTFGKYKGRLIKDVISFDKNYCSWLSKQKQIMERFEGLAEALKKNNIN